ncbi:MAG: GNAT family N-acetyltransferase [Cupriavidus sp.]|uniref:GNAT family N-acetyltransferase n=1 Tax=Cupriavidus sp. TaxID=1873897 RepID=UPI001C0002FF|nr:GNAT family N-acetyltransferase [Cupriavidus sp.]QWE96481.1 GNAT family N-acetyltransferase [Cupriavidus sp. EM10]MCA3193822.1 GNAT family N-acetyltransferase [Cupriavidus sp.]MCA3196205.1 GNAT family N-acetyltransferase [Cupriavidus sp.]MCA3203726.1 GNAT family N-acetyltransferase [Cupriavidus sp.]MCA3205999.1 GNAT family N-acetyltransferase [Cupriavidus sp.]
MAKIGLHRFDPESATPAQWAQFHRFRRLRLAQDFPADPILPDHEAETILHQQRPTYETQRLLAMRNGQIAGVLILTYRREESAGSEDYRNHVEVGGGVLLSERRQGVGKALLGGLADFMDHRNKTIATARVHLPEGHAYMATIGAKCNLRNVESRLPFDQIRWEELSQWAERPALSAPTLAWEVHAGRVPFAALRALMKPLSALLNEQPLGTLEGPSLRYELENFPAWYAEMDRRGGDHFLVLLRDGEKVAAVCDAYWDQRFPDRIQQELTAVVGPWRNQGLAKAVKARMLMLVRERHPEVKTAITNNANSNAPMLSINRQLGFSVHRETGTYQIGNDALRNYLAGRVSTSTGVRR